MLTLEQLCKKINDTPLLMSLLYDIDLLPEQIEEGDARRWGYVAAIVGHMEQALSQPAPALSNERVREIAKHALSHTGWMGTAKYALLIDVECAINQALQESQAPSGYVMVPVEPTEEMINAAWDNAVPFARGTETHAIASGWSGFKVENIYRAMLDEAAKRG